MRGTTFTKSIFDVLMRGSETLPGVFFPIAHKFELEDLFKPGMKICWKYTKKNLGCRHLQER